MTKQVYLVRVEEAWAGSPLPEITHNKHLAACFRSEVPEDWRRAEEWAQHHRQGGNKAWLSLHNLEGGKLTEVPWYKCPECRKLVQGYDDEYACEPCRDKQEDEAVRDERATLRSRGLL